MRIVPQPATNALEQADRQTSPLFHELPCLASAASANSSNGSAGYDEAADADDDGATRRRAALVELSRDLRLTQPATNSRQLPVHVNARRNGAPTPRRRLPPPPPFFLIPAQSVY